jgi:hypothetical protein
MIRQDGLKWHGGLFGFVGPLHESRAATLLHAAQALLRTVSIAAAQNNAHQTVAMVLRCREEQWICRRSSVMDLAPSLNRMVPASMTICLSGQCDVNPPLLNDLPIRGEIDEWPVGSAQERWQHATMRSDVRDDEDRPGATKRQRA